MDVNMTLVSLLPSQNFWIYVLLVIISPLLATYIISLWNSSATIRSFIDPRRPPTAPYYLPYIGHAIDILFRPFDLFEENWERFGRDGLWKLILPGQASYQVSTADQVAKVFRGQGMEVSESISRSLEYSFGMPREAASLYERDDSGYGPNIATDSKVKPNERILVTQHDFMARQLSGGSLESIALHYQKHLVETLRGVYHDLGDDWVQLPNLAEFMHEHITKAALISMYGPHLIRLNPTIVEDLWAFIPDVMTLFLNPPRFFMRKAYQLRDRLLDNITRYYDHAKNNYDLNGPDEEWEEFWGSQFIRKKHSELWPRFELMNTKARAAEDLSFLWASNANSVDGAVWFLVQTLLDPDLLRRVTKEVVQARSISTNEAGSRIIDTQKICSMPVSQAIYAEVLRLRVSVFVLRKAKHDLDFAGWSIKKGERVCASSVARARDDRIWNTGTAEDPHPLNEFWADRFLVYPDDPASGPVRRTADLAKEKEVAEDEDSENEPRFSMAGLTNSWIPYSGGARLCPGRHFAKQEIIVTAAVMLSLFEIELQTPKGWVAETAAGIFGGGTLPIKGKIPCRIRRRR